MRFSQLTVRERLRNMEDGLRSVPAKLCHLGSTLTDANETRDWRVRCLPLNHSVSIWTLPYMGWI